MNITLIGAGGVATSLGLGIIAAGHSVIQVYSRTAESAKRLAEQLSCKWTDSISDIDLSADICIISVKDDAIATLSEQLSKRAQTNGTLFVHTAGSIPMDVLNLPRRGVFYPMQTFSRQRTVDFHSVPVFIEANSETDHVVIENFAKSLSNSVHTLSSEDRKWLHVAAVFCCNFANHCSALASTLLSRHGIPFDTMLPLIDETTRKLHTLSPVDAQTGPAARWDKKVMSAHEEMLADDADLQRIYRIMSESIHNITQKK